MAKLIGTDNNQIPTNGMLGGMAFQSPEDVTADKIQENRENVVTAADIGLDPNQIPLVQMLGSNAFTNIKYNIGEWIPTVANLGNHTVGSARSGWFLELGNFVFVSFYYNWTGRTTTNGGYGVRISNLPINASSDMNVRARGSVFIGGLEGVRAAAGRTHYGGYVDSDNLYFRVSGDDVSEVSLDGSIATSLTNGYIYGHAFYRAATR